MTVPPRVARVRALRRALTIAALPKRFHAALETALADSLTSSDQEKETTHLQGFSRDGEGGIRTRGPRERTPVFKTGAFDRSATPPGSADAMLALHSRQHPGEVAEWLKALAC